MKAGYACADITPKNNVSLSGFVARCNRPSEGVDDPIEVHALVVEEGAERVLLVVLDLLALGPEILSGIHQALDALPKLRMPRSHRIFCCTHTHSAPATIQLLGCGVVEQRYWDRLIPTIAQAVSDAAARMRPARLRKTIAHVPGANYNRRRVLEDGRVMMTQYPKSPVRKTGPEWDQFLFLRFEDESGTPIVALVNWAAHACTVCGNRVSGDFPAELRRRLEARSGIPFIYLQGAAGNLNPPFLEMTREEMLRNVDGIMSAMPPIAWEELIEPTPFHLLDLSLALSYQPIPSLQELEAVRSGMQQIAETGRGPARQMTDLVNILNVEPGQDPDPQKLRYIASVLKEWADRLIPRNAGLIQRQSVGEFRAPELSLKTWRIGSLVLCFIAAEPFVETALKIVQAFPSLSVVVVGYASPLVGYLPTDEALTEGGYDVDYAYRFYGNPAGYAPGSEPSAVKIIQQAIRSSGKF